MIYALIRSKNLTSSKTYLRRLQFNLLVLLYKKPWLSSNSGFSKSKCSSKNLSNSCNSRILSSNNSIIRSLLCNLRLRLPPLSYLAPNFLPIKFNRSLLSRTSYNSRSNRCSNSHRLSSKRSIL